MKTTRIFAIGTLLTLATTVTALFAQQPDDSVQVPDKELLLTETMDGLSPYYYPKLFSRYMAGDTTLTLDEYRRLYYGYAWQGSYEPLTSPKEKDQLLLLVAATKDSLSREEAEQIVALGLSVMESDPFSPSNLNFLVYGYGAIGNALQERINYHRLQMVIRTIRSSGSGLRESSPWHVLAFSHATDMMSYLNQDYGTRRVVSRTTEYIPLLMRQADGVKGYYFNFERVYWKEPTQQMEKQSSGWKFNGIPIKKHKYPLTTK